MNKKNILWVRLGEVDSTNSYAKTKRAEKFDLIVTAKRQTGGRGTKGRSFSSEEGGLYFTKLSFYDNFPAKNAFKIMIGAAVSVCEVLSFYGLSPAIKWPNDIHVGGKKICGILIENEFSGRNISSSVVGIGLNVCNLLPAELADIATTLLLESGKEYSVDEVAQRLADELEKGRSMQEYRRYLGYVGENVTLLVGEEKISAVLLGVEEDGRLVVQAAEEKKILAAGEVTLRL